jgi:hypothetical protein
MQLIQILCIKLSKPADAELAATKAGPVNRNSAGAKSKKAASGHADTAFELQKSMELPAGALYRAVTLSSSVSGSCS